MGHRLAAHASSPPRLGKVLVTAGTKIDQRNVRAESKLYGIALGVLLSFRPVRRFLLPDRHQEGKNAGFLHAPREFTHSASAGPKTTTADRQPVSVPQLRFRHVALSPEHPDCFRGGCGGAGRYLLECPDQRSNWKRMAERI